MSKNEGETLRKLVKGSGLQVQEFAEKLGMTRQNLNYLFKKDRIGEEVREKTAALLDSSPNELFDKQNVNRNLSADPEKEALRDLVEAQKEIIKNFRQFVTAQLIRSEAFQSETLYRLAEVRLLIDPKKKGAEVSQEVKQYEQGVEDRIKDIQSSLGL
ncbi:helix-turn-helix transcriptional regulator [Chitinophaga sp.]|uniref:helix-turn-helix transcriptional regulator n=1 Tax=Chitinophaga sp. TaxID=1869181 RepID=UPI0031DBE034